MDMVLSFLISAGIIAFGVWVVVGDDHCGLAFGLDDHGTTCHPSRGARPLWVGSGCQDTVGIPFSA
jgi:hypothetical protein